MAKITFDVPDDVAEQLRELEARLKRLEADKIGVEDAIPEDDIETYNGNVYTDVHYEYEDDGDLIEETDAASQTWLRAVTTANQTRSYGYEANTDRLASWIDDGAAESLVFDVAGRRTIETVDTTDYDYSYHSTITERLLSKTTAAASDPREVAITYDGIGRMTALDWGADGGTPDVTFGYGALGNTTTVTTSSGTTTSKYDAQMRRSRIEYPTGSVRWLYYGFGRAPLQENFASGSTSWRHENIYLAGQPVAQLATRFVSGSIAAGPARLHLHTDRMGVVRKIARWDGAFKINRYVIDAWGSSNTAGLVVDTSFDPVPSWNWRYPGQYADAGGVYNNGWRVYVPEIGQYTSPEPLHANLAAGFYGPQAYSYAAQQPLKYVDPDGLEAGTCTNSQCLAALAEADALMAPVGGATGGAGAGAGSAGASGVGRGIGTAILCFLGIACPPEPGREPPKPTECSDGAANDDEELPTPGGTGPGAPTSGPPQGPRMRCPLRLQVLSSTDPSKKECWYICQNGQRFMLEIPAHLTCPSAYTPGI
jgi:RHS repeat-associated protein